MKLVAVGSQGAGKTSYLARMYGMMQAGVLGFRLQAANHDRLMEMAYALERGIKPGPTVGRTMHDMRVFCDWYDLGQMTWVEYPEKACGPNADQANTQLINDLQTAAATIVFIDTPLVLRDQTAANNAKQLVKQVSRILKARGEATAMAITYAKYDLVTDDEDDLAADLLELLEDVKPEDEDKVDYNEFEVSCGNPGRNIVIPLAHCLTVWVAAYVSERHKFLENEVIPRVVTNAEKREVHKELEDLNNLMLRQSQLVLRYEF